MDLHLKLNPTFEEAACVGEAIREQEGILIESLGCSPADSCLVGIRESEYIGTIQTKDGKAVALVGIVEDDNFEDTGLVWSMSSIEVAKYPLAFVKIMRQLMEEYGGLYSRLLSLASSDNEAHQRFHITLGMLPTGEELPIPHTPLTYKVYELITTKGLNKLYYEQS